MSYILALLSIHLKPVPDTNGSCDSVVDFQL